MPAFRASLVLALLLLARGLSAQESFTPPTDEVFEIVPLADGVWAALVRDRPPVYAFANSLVVRGDAGVLVVDTQASPAASQALIDWIEREIGRPVTHVVTTHWHGDHVNGNEAYADAYPGVEFVAHTTLLEDVPNRTAHGNAEEIATLPPSIVDRRRWLETGTGPDGTPLTEDDRARVRRSLELRSVQLETLRSLRLVPPTKGFDDRLVVDLGGRVVEILHLGHAHTRGDAVVWLPGERIAAVGDILEKPWPWVDEGSSPVGWAAALDRLAALDPAILVPGHGEVERDGELLAGLRQMFRGIASAVGGGAEPNAQP